MLGFALLCHVNSRGYDALPRLGQTRAVRVRLNTSSTDGLVSEDGKCVAFSITQTGGRWSFYTLDTGLAFKPTFVPPLARKSEDRDGDLWGPVLMIDRNTWVFAETMWSGTSTPTTKTIVAKSRGTTSRLLPRANDYITLALKGEVGGMHNPWRYSGGTVSETKVQNVGSHYKLWRASFHLLASKAVLTPMHNLPAFTNKKRLLPTEVSDDGTQALFAEENGGYWFWSRSRLHRISFGARLWHGNAILTGPRGIEVSHDGRTRLVGPDYEFVACSRHQKYALVRKRGTGETFLLSFK